MTLLSNDLAPREDPIFRARYFAPYFCPDCQVGQSIPNCWLCGNPARKIENHNRGLPNGVGVCTWKD